MFEYLKYSRNLRRLQKKQTKITTEYNKQIDEARQKKNQAEVKKLSQLVIYEYDIVERDIEITRSRYYINEANRLVIPIPAYDDKEIWDDKFRGRGVLTKKGTAEIRSLIRQEKKEKMELIQTIIKTIIVPLTGIIGALTGLLAIIFALK